MCIVKKLEPHKHYRDSFGVWLSIIAWLFFSAPVYSATLSLNPSTGSYVVGSSVALEVIVDTEGETINAVSGSLEYPTESLRPTSIRTSDSVINLWIQQPSISKISNTVFFEGLILNPGFSGKGKVATIYFEVIGPGISKVSFSSGLTLANDGFGTNVLSRLLPAQFQFIGSAGEKIVRGEIEELPFDPNELVTGRLRPPVVTNYTERPKTMKDFFVQGVTYPNAEVDLWVQHPIGEPERITIATVGAGNFSFRYDSKTNVIPLLQASALSSLKSSLRGIPYRFWLSAVVNGVETPPTQAFEMTVGGIGIPELLLLIIILLILGVVALLIFVMYLLRRMYDRDEHCSVSFKNNSE
jgi:hypothetical protein